MSEEPAVGEQTGAVPATGAVSGPTSVVGVLGGMGPAATAHFQTRLVALTDAATDAAHPTVVTWSDGGVPDRVAALRGTGPSPVPVLRAGLAVLAGAGARVLAVPCNTVHPFLPEALEGSPLRLVDMIEAAADEAAAAGVGTAAVIATAATLEHGMYERALAGRSVLAHTPGERTQSEVLELIAAVKAGVPVRDLLPRYEATVRDLAEAGCDGVVVACSEISVLAAAVSATAEATAATGHGRARAGSPAPSVATVDAVDALARASLVAAGSRPRA